MQYCNKHKANPPMLKCNECFPIDLAVQSVHRTDEDIEREIEEAAKSHESEKYNNETDLDYYGVKDSYSKGAREFIKRTEERVWREAIEYAEATFGREWVTLIKKEGKRLGYLK